MKIKSCCYLFWLLMLVSNFCLFPEEISAKDQLTFTQVMSFRGPFAFVRKNPSVIQILDVTSNDALKQVGWTTFSLTTQTTTNTNAVFLSLWASCERVPQTQTPENISGYVSIRQKGQTSWYWQRSVENVYWEDAGDGFSNIYMDGLNPPFLVLCPTNESHEIEYRYSFSTPGGGNSYRFQFYITVLGYLEGTFVD